MISKIPPNSIVNCWQPTTSPYPMSKRMIDKKWAQSDENEKCWKCHFLRPSTSHNDGNHQSKHHLKCNENKCRHTRCSSQTTIQWNVVKKYCVSCPSNDTTLWSNVRSKTIQVKTPLTRVTPNVNEYPMINHKHDPIQRPANVCINIDKALFALNRVGCPLQELIG